MKLHDFDAEMLQKLFKSWEQYRYRLVPWLALNLKNRSARYVENTSKDKILDDSVIEYTLLKVCDAFYDRHFPAAKPTESYEHATNLNVIHETLGFTIEKIESEIPNGGAGVGVMKGKIPKGSLVSLYPGTIYQPTDPVLWQSLGNCFMFRCIDGVLIDGSSTGLSRIVFMGCTSRESSRSVWMCDKTWMSSYPRNPLSIGQYVNNQTKEFPANVVYQEFDLPDSFPLPLRKYIPNVVFSPYTDANLSQRFTRMVALVSLRDIYAGEELFSSYFTIVEGEKNNTSGQSGQN